MISATYKIATLKDNGRSTTRTLNCSGQVLTETDEDGVTTTYGYNTARQLVEVIREEIKDGDVVVTPETITTYTYDAAGRTLTTRRIGAMETTESTEFDSLGRVTKQTDVLGRVTTTAYSADGLTTTVTTPAGATSITTRNVDGSTASVSGTAQRSLVYVYDLNGNSFRTTTKLADGTTIAQSIVNGFGQTTVQAQASTTGFIYSRSEYNAKGQLVKQYQDTGWNTAKTAATLYEYDSFGNISKQTLALADSPTKDNSPVVEMAHSVEAAEDGVYSVTTQTRYNAEGTALTSSQKQLISQLSGSLEQKTITVNERCLTSINYTLYTAPTVRTTYSSIPTSTITACAVVADGFTLSQTDYAGITSTTARNTARQGKVMNDNFTHNTRSELAAATVNGADYAYLYDNNGNRTSAVEGDDSTVYTANALNQYTSIQENAQESFSPQFDTDGNLTLIKTSTGIWSAVYNAENRPITFTNSENNTVVECQYDSMGRRAYKKVTVNGSVTLHQRYLYRDYLQIACCDLTRTAHPCLWLITWDPTQPIATRPLAIQKDGTWFTYGLDLTKNVCEVFGPVGNIRTAYTYSPYGSVTATGNVTQPIQWSSEYYDTELFFVYYNFRHYTPVDGRWLGRDFLDEKVFHSRYLMVNNNTIQNVDIIGLAPLLGGNTATDAAIKGLLSGSLTLEGAAKYLGITVAALLARIEKRTGKRAKCKPCEPPVGTRMEEMHDSHRHNGMCPHYHIHTVHQSPPSAGCRCFAPKEETVAISQGYPKYEYPRGGGIIFV